MLKRLFSSVRGLVIICTVYILSWSSPHNAPVLWPRLSWSGTPLLLPPFLNALFPMDSGHVTTVYCRIMPAPSFLSKSLTSAGTHFPVLNAPRPWIRAQIMPFPRLSASSTPLRVKYTSPRQVHLSESSKPLRVKYTSPRQVRLSASSKPLRVKYASPCQVHLSPSSTPLSVKYASPCQVRLSASSTPLCF